MADQYQKMTEDVALTNREQNLISDFKERYGGEKDTPLLKPGILSRLLFSWMGPLFRQEFHYNLREIDTGESCYRKLKERWDLEYPVWAQAPGAKTSAKPLVRAILSTYPKMFIVYLTLSFLLAGVEYMNAKIMEVALQDLQSQKKGATFEQKLEGAGKLIFALIFSQVMMTLLRQQSDFLIALLTQRLKHGINGLIYDKVMMKSIQRDPTFSIGEITNITQIDVEKIADMGTMVNRLFIAPIQITFGLVWLYTMVHNVLFIGLGFLILMIFVNLEFSKQYKLFRTRFLHIKDKRGKLITEVFSNIRYIKMTGLENYFLQKIQSIKDSELYWINRDFNMATVFYLLNNSTPQIFLCLIFGGYLFFYGAFSVALLFTVIQVYNIFKWNFSSLPFILTWLLDITVSGQRITFFLLSENINDSYITKLDPEVDLVENAIEIENGNFYWEDPELRYMYNAEKNRIAHAENEYQKKGTNKEKKRSGAKKPARETVQSIQRQRALTGKRKAVATLRTKISNVFTNNNDKTLNTVSGFSGATLELDKSDFGTQEDFENYNRLVEKLSEMTADDDVEETLIEKEVPGYRGVYEGIKFNLRNIDIKIKRGACIGVIGSVGSGKSSLLSCLSGELYNKVGSRINICGSMAYVSQRAWIPSMTIKDSILFGKEFEEQRYKDCIEFSCMTDDLRILAKNDQTMLGEKGVNLSGGQKIRLSIARAMYSDSDIYLFDDPISALDIHVGKYVMEEGIVNYLKGKTRIVATHAIAYLKYFDYIYIMDDGQIVEEGDYDYISSTKEFTKMKSMEEAKKDEVKEKDNDDNKKQAANKQDGKEIVDEAQQNPEETTKYNFTGGDNVNLNNSTNQGSLTKQAADEEAHQSLVELDDIDDGNQKKIIEDIIQSEDRVKGAISNKIFKNWITLTGGVMINLILLFPMFPWSLTLAGIPWFLQFFASMDILKGRSGWRMALEFSWKFFLILIVQQLFYFIHLKIIFSGNLKMSKEVHFKMTFKAIHASINKYFDRIPVGRLLNRFMKDVAILDEDLAWYLIFALDMTFTTLTAFSVSAASSSLLMFFVIFIYIYMSFRIQRYYMKLVRELTRLNSISSTPIIHKFKENLEGVSSIRFFEKNDVQFDQYTQKVDDYQKNLIALKGALGWFNIRICLLSLLVIIPTVLIALFIAKIKVGLFGLMLNFLLMTTENVNELLKNYSDYENKLISLERCCTLMEVTAEAGYKNLDNLEVALRNNERIEGSKEKNWPKKAKIVIKNLSIKYRPSLPYVIRKLALRVRSGSKVGIVGRTGAGKTTLISSLYRTFDDYKGQIIIDGVEIRDLDLKVLRQAMTIIPQDPYLFEDTLRNNIDPMGEFSDEEIEAILTDVDLWRKFLELEGLYTKIEKEGGNLSQGEKQLVCMARALLFKKKLVLMDEATSNIDVKTEQIIQKLIKERFADSTVLVIAHRLNTILHCDKVLVLEQGEILEYDDLQNLKGNKDSHFGRMLMKSDEIQSSLV